MCRRPLIEGHGGCFRCRCGLRAEGRAPHPWLRLDMPQPIFYRRNPTEIVGHVLLANGAHGNGLAVTVLYGRSKNGGAQKNPLAVMAKRAVPKIGEMGLAFIKPIVDCQIVLRLAAKEPRRSHGVMIGMCHSQS